MGGSFGLIIGIFDGGSGDDFWVFSTAWVSNWRHGFVDRWLEWWVWWPLLAPTGLMVCVCVCVALLMALLALSDRFFFFFFFFNMSFCSAGILVGSGQWWLGFFWVFVLMGLCVSHRC